MNIQPLHDRVVIKPDAENTSSNIIIPEKFSKFGTRGTVVAVGPGRRFLDGKLYPLSVKVGDKVVYSKMHNFPMREDGTDYIVVQEEGVLCVVEED